MESGDNISLDNRLKKKFPKKKIFSKRNNIIFASILIVIILFLLSWLLFVERYEGCKSWECFNENLVSCNNAKFAGGNEIIFGYIIQGREGSDCLVEVEFLQGEIANRNAKKLIGEKMTCKLPSGIIFLPESDLDRCSGPLKEKLQEQVINKLHNYIIQNVGQINKELLNPLNYQ